MLRTTSRLLWVLDPFIWALGCRAICAALPTANADLLINYDSLHCKPLLFWFPCKWRNML